MDLFYYALCNFGVWPHQSSLIFIYIEKKPPECSWQQTVFVPWEKVGQNIHFWFLLPLKEDGRKEKDENKPKQKRSVGAVTRSYSSRNVSTFSLLLHFTEFLQVTWLVLLFPFFYSHRQTLRRMISHPHPIGATAAHGTDLLFILKCLSRPPRSVCARRGGDWEERGCGGALQCR